MKRFLFVLVALLGLLVAGCVRVPPVVILDPTKIPVEFQGTWYIAEAYINGEPYASSSINPVIIRERDVKRPKSDEVILVESAIYDAKKIVLTVIFKTDEIWFAALDKGNLFVIVFDLETHQEIIRFIAQKTNPLQQNNRYMPQQNDIVRKSI